MVDVNVVQKSAAPPKAPAAGDESDPSATERPSDPQATMDGGVATEDEENATGGAPRRTGNRSGRSETGDDEPLDYELIELIFFAYRDFIGDADLVLERFGFGRAHHRVLYFVDRKPGMTVAELLDTLRITKQSLARVLKQLVDEGYIAQEPGLQDRRQRLLTTTDKGHVLVRALIMRQSDRIARALGAVPPGSRERVVAFLDHMIDRPANARGPATDHWQETEDDGD